MTLVSVVIPTVDRPALLAEAVASALAQTHRDLEVIIVLSGVRPETAPASKRDVVGASFAPAPAQATPSAMPKMDSET